MLAEHSPLERMRVAPTAVRRLVIDDNAQAATRHALEEYALLLDPTPRAMKRFVMQYSMFRAVRTAEGSVIPTGPLALWTVLHTRWPLLAELLQATPEAVQFFEGPATRIPPSVPEDLRRVFTDPPVALREVMNHVAGPLDEATIREASGQA